MLPWRICACFRSFFNGINNTFWHFYLFSVWWFVSVCICVCAPASVCVCMHLVARYSKLTGGFQEHPVRWDACNGSRWQRFNNHSSMGLWPYHSSTQITVLYHSSVGLRALSSTQITALYHSSVGLRALSSTQITALYHSSVWLRALSFINTNNSVVWIILQCDCVLYRSSTFIFLFKQDYYHLSQDYCFNAQGPDSTVWSYWLDFNIMFTAQGHLRMTQSCHKYTQFKTPDAKPYSHLWWSLCTLYLHACHASYCRRLRSLLLCSCDVFWATINSLVCWFILGSARSVQTHSKIPQPPASWDSWSSLSQVRQPQCPVARLRSDNLSVLLHVLGQATSVSCCTGFMK